MDTHTATPTRAPASPSRRHFLVTSSAAAGGLMLGFHVPIRAWGNFSTGGSRGIRESHD